MDAEAKLSTLQLMKEEALVGARLSHVLHNYASLEHHVNRRFAPLLSGLDATLQTLNRLAELIQGKPTEKGVLNIRGLKYVETLVNEYAIAMERILWIISGNRPWRNAYAPQYWKSSAVADGKGQTKLLKAEIDEGAIYQALKSYEKNGKLGQIEGPSDRFEELQLQLLLVVQIITIYSITKTIPSGIDKIRDFIDYQGRIWRAAKLAGVSDRNGKVLKRKSRIVNKSCSTCSGSDSEVDFITVRSASPPVSRPKSYNQAPPPPPPDWFRTNQLSPPPPPPGWLNSPLTSSPKTVSLTTSKALGCEKSTASLAEPQPLHTPNVIAAGQHNPEHQLPSYSERDGVPVPHGLRGEAPNLAMNNDLKRPKSSNTKSSDQTEPEISTDHVAAGKNVEQSIDNSACMPNPKSTVLGRKFRNLFRTKASLEVETKRNLAENGASLTAFIIQEDHFRKIPHSAFHSLESIHMRTILSQLKDKTWFKTFSDLTIAEHSTLDVILCQNIQGEKGMQRELVVLKVLQQNRFNAWLRVIETCIGVEESGFGYRYENGRIILAVFRETLCESVKAFVSTTSVPKLIENSDQLPAAPIPELLPFMPSSGKVISDLSNFGTLTYTAGSRVAPCGFMAGPPSPKGRFYPPPPPPPNSSPWESSRRPFSDSFENHLSSDLGNKSPPKAVFEHSAREALTSYTAFTFRPALPGNNAVNPLVHFPAITWGRCSLAREHETKANLQKRIEQFKCRQQSIIDMKLHLKDDVSAQVTRLIEELNQIEVDNKFEHTLVELTLVENKGTNQKPTTAYIDVMHVIVQRAPKDDVVCVERYNQIMNPPLRRPPSQVRVPPPCGPAWIPPSDGIVHIQSPRKVKAKKPPRSPATSVTYSSSSSSSDKFSSSEGESFKRNRKQSNRRRSTSSGSDSDLSSDDTGDEERGNLRKRRWKVDPIKITFSRDENGKDIVKVLLEKWTGEEIAKEEGKEVTKKDGKEKEDDEKKRKERK